jgi:hypothetical protein
MSMEEAPSGAASPGDKSPISHVSAQNLSTFEPIYQLCKGVIVFNREKHDISCHLK